MLPIGCTSCAEFGGREADGDAGGTAIDAVSEGGSHVSGVDRPLGAGDDDTALVLVTEVEVTGGGPMIFLSRLERADNCIARSRTRSATAVAVEVDRPTTGLTGAVDGTNFASASLSCTRNCLISRRI